MSRLGLLARGLFARRGLTALILLVAVIAVAAATTGPAYQTAARHSILADDLHSAPTLGTIIDLDARGALSDLSRIEGAVGASLQQLPARDLFHTQIRGEELGVKPGSGQSGVLAWRDGLCQHLRWVQGRCPTAAGEVVVSTALAAQNHLRVGQDLPVLGTSRIVGVYQPLDPNDRYWAARCDRIIQLHAGRITQDTPPIQRA